MILPSENKETQGEKNQDTTQKTRTYMYGNPPKGLFEVMDGYMERGRDGGIERGRNGERERWREGGMERVKD